MQILDKSGFTVLELTVVAAIVAIVVAITVPTYQTYTSRARQTRAKVLLSAGYTTEVTFATENMSFSSCLADIGFKHDSSGGDLYYAIGFSDTALGQNTCGRTGNLPCHRKSFPVPGAPVACSGLDAGGISANLSNLGGVPTAPRSLLNSLATDISQNTFVIRAVGNINYQSEYDRWTIDHNKNVINIDPKV